MITRREFIQNTATATIVTAASVPVAYAAETMMAGTSGRKAAATPLPHIRSVIRRDETIVRTGGNGNFLGMTWTADDQQALAFVEGGGWPGMPPDLWVDSGLVTVSGNPPDVTFQAVPGYPVRSERYSEVEKGGVPGYFGAGTLAVDGHIFQYLSTSNGPAKTVESGNGSYRIDPNKKPWGAKLIYSPNNGRTWCNQDGSTPVILEPASAQSRNTMVFWDEPQDAFSGGIILQMGKDYQDNRDGFVYVYGGRDMFRAPKAGILDRKTYEFFAGLRRGNRAHWVKDINARVAAHIPNGWGPASVVFNAPLGLYMMACVHVELIHVPDEGKDLMEPSELALFTARNPWGPWDPIHHEKPWAPAGDRSSRPCCAQIAPKWIAEDGKSFWLVWSEVHHTSEVRQSLLKELTRATSEDEWIRLCGEYRRTHQRYRFSTQRVDLVIA